MKQVLGALAVSIEELRIRLFRDLARFVQYNLADLNGSARQWMEQCCHEICSSVVNEEDYFQWFAAACDNTSDVETWRAPLWLGDALGISKQHIRLQEEPEESEVVSIHRFLAESNDCDRLDALSTDKLVNRVFISRDLARRMRFLSSKETQEIDLLLVLVTQGAKLPLGLHDNEEESIVSTVSRHLASLPQMPKRRRRNRPVISVQRSEREEKIRRVIAAGRKGLAYCRALDEEKVRIPFVWVEKGCPEKYVAAYKAGKPWRHNINNEKWQFTKPPRKRI